MPTAQVNGIKLYYEMAGEGTAVVLSHGYTGNHYDWALQIPTLARKYRVIAVDHRGHGLSESPPAGYSIPLFARDIHALLRHLEIDNCYFVGHSMGGFIALQFIVDYPQMVSALVLVDTRSSGVGNIPAYAEFKRRLHRIAQIEGMEAAFEYEIAHNPMTKEYLEKHPEKREVVKQKMLQTSVEGYVYAGEAILEWGDLTPQLSEIRVPTLVFVGEEDTYLIEPSKVIAEAIPGAKLRIIPGAGHSPQEEAPYTFNRELMSFLAEVDQVLNKA